MVTMGQLRMSTLLTPDDVGVQVIVWASDQTKYKLNADSVRRCPDTGKVIITAYEDGNDVSA